MDSDYMIENPSDLADAMSMIRRLRAEVKRRPKLAVIKVDQPQDSFGADKLPLVQRGQQVTITLETDNHTFEFTAIQSGDGPVATFTTKG
jgi:hypothetical protein